MTGGGDLDNYLFPIVRRLGANRFNSVFGIMAHKQGSTIAITPSRQGDAAPPPNMRVRTPVSTSSKNWKAQVNAACAAACLVTPPNLDGGPLAVDIEFQVSEQRNWSTLWKPAIDSLGPVLGLTNPARSYMPNDDRIVSLGLHRSIGNGVCHCLVDTLTCEDSGLAGRHPSVLGVKRRIARCDVTKRWSRRRGSGS